MNTAFLILYLLTAGIMAQQPYDYLAPRQWCIECDTYDSDTSSVILESIKP